MTSITLSTEEAAAYDEGGEGWEEVKRLVLGAAKDRAQRDGALCDVYHPEGFVVGAVEPSR